MSHPTPTEITLANLAGGALMECASAELRRICVNILDPNVKAEAKRKLTIEILMEPDETRQQIRITYSLKAGIPGPDSGKTIAILAMDPNSQTVALYEAYTPQSLFPDLEPLPNVTDLPAKRA